MRAVILAGGKGTRMLPYTTVLPKPLVPVGERPIIDLVVHQLVAAGFDEIDISVGHLGHLIRAYFDGEAVLPPGVNLTYTWEHEPLGTAGALKLIDGLDEPFLVMNGDILTDINYCELITRHRERGVALTIATHQKDVALALGVVEGQGEIVTGYVEKPTLHYEVSMGIYVYDPSVIDVIPDGKFDFPDVVLALIAAGRPVGAYPFTGNWYDIGTPAEYEAAARFLHDNPETFEPRSKVASPSNGH